MKTSSFLPLILISALFFIASCKKDKCVQTVTYKTYEPVYMSYEELRSAVKSEPAQALKKPGKIYMKGNYIFINEIDKGIHIIDNTNPVSPQNIAFINIPGNIDIAAIGNVLYADSYIDLLTLDISNPSNVTVLKRTENALPQRIFTGGYYADPSKGVAIEWVEKKVTEEIETDCSGGGYGGGPVFFEGDVLSNSGGFSSSQSSSDKGGRTIAPGVGGSMARFTINGYTLYVVDQTSLLVFDISNNANPVPAGNAYIGRNIETIFPYKNHLFIGSTNGMFIYNISNPTSPVYVSEYIHGTACDPVVVDDNYAYITLRSGTPCNTDFNQLEVVNIQNLSNPILVNTVPMYNPHGLGIDNSTLFICDGTDGLKVYNATNVITIANNQIAHFKNIQATDVIPYNNRLLMIGENGFYQYDYSDIQNISLLSVIPIEK
jgi:hypothetical protein